MPLSSLLNPSGLIVSQQEPSNPINGTTWLELDNLQNPLEKWTRLNNRWFSEVHTISYGSQSATLIAPNYALDTSYDFFFIDWVVSLYTSSGISGTNSFNVRFNMYLNQNNVDESAIKSCSFQNMAPDESKVITQPIKVLWIPSAKEYLRFLLSVSGSITGVRNGITLKYRLLRK